MEGKCVNKKLKAREISWITNRIQSWGEENCVLYYRKHKPGKRKKVNMEKHLNVGLKTLNMFFFKIL